MRDAFKQTAWYLVSIYLLAVYLTFFHLLNGADAKQVQGIGAAFSAIWLSSCFVFQNCFRNRFEFSIHALLTLDFCFESLVANHNGDSFYYCAAGFWAVFLFYHHLPLRQPRISPHGNTATT
jgi:hypothetical protein|tara:strand:- start:951 stop:1316 length:366 start_codon:yes stop_codon:yes gene_type:complete